MDRYKIEMFEQFWDLYDYKKARKTAMRAWLKINPNDYPLILKHAKLFVTYTFKDKFPSRPYPATYLNGERYYDEHSIDEDDNWLDNLKGNRYAK